MKILIVNSDLAKNRGDRAITEGNVELIKARFPDATVTALSQYPKRDTEWYGIDFLDMDFQSLNPFEILRLGRVARKNDIVLWGGGEILKDYTNKAALWYWVIKMTVISWFNPNLYGAYQGIGPTKSGFSKKLIVHVVGRCKTFIVRDKESYDKLIDWGVDAKKLRYASDPAVLPVPAAIDNNLSQKLQNDFSIDESFLNDFIAIGPRDWFHYKTGGIIPFKYKKKLYSLVGKSLTKNSPKHAHYIECLTTMISTLTSTYKTNVLIIPMHMSESDTELAQLLRDHSANPSAVRILEKDSLSPSELRSVVARATAMVGFRLHSNIIGISAGVPSVNIYYVDKGRVFFDQIKQSEYALPIENVLDDNFVESFMALFEDLYKNRSSIKSEISAATDTLRAAVTETFNETFNDKK